MAHYFYPSQQENAKTLVMSSGLGGHADFWQPQIEFLQRYFNVFTYDQKGVFLHSSLLADGYAIQDMAQELWQLLQDVDIQQCYFVGHALGAFIGLELARIAPQCVEKLVLINAWDVLDAHTERCFSTRLHLLNESGVKAYVQAQALFLYPPYWISQHDAVLRQQEEKMMAHFPPLENIRKRLAALMAYEPLYTAQNVTQPCWLLSNQDDFLVPWQRGMALAKLLKNSHFELLPYGAHASTVTQAFYINQWLVQCLI
ncbi:MAG: pyrimidine utilization protein D [Acinetobacter sp.]